MRSSPLAVIALLLLTGAHAFAAESFQPAYSADTSLNADSLSDEDYQFRHLIDSQNTRRELAIVKAKSVVLQKDLERAKVLVNGPSFSREALAFKEWEYRESVAEIARLEGLAQFHMAHANVYKLRVQKGQNLSNADLKAETEFRIQAYKAKLSGAVASLEAVRYLKTITEVKDLNGRQLLRNGSITQSDADKRASYVAGAREQEEILVAQIDSLQKMIASLKKTQERL